MTPSAGATDYTDFFLLKGSVGAISLIGEIRGKAMGIIREIRS
jgi:hypothetical protein